MTTRVRRLTDLEKARAAYAGPLVLFVDEPPTDAQRRAIEEAERIGRTVVRAGLLDLDL